MSRERETLRGIYEYAYGASGETGDDAGHLTHVGMMAKQALEADEDRDPELIERVARWAYEQLRERRASMRAWEEISEMTRKRWLEVTEEVIYDK